MTENTVSFEYTLRPRGDQPMYVPVIGEPYNPPEPLRYLHLQIQLPFTVNRDYGLAVDWYDDAGMTPSVNKVISLASDKTYSAGVLELTEDNELVAHYTDEAGMEQAVKLVTAGSLESAELVRVALNKLFTGEYKAEAVQLEDEDEEPGDNETQAPNIVAAFWDSNPDDEGDDNDEYDD